VEWLMKFESDSILCANSDDSLNDWLDYSWAGAPRQVQTYHVLANTANLFVAQIPG